MENSGQISDQPLSPRAQQWAATMGGHAVSSFSRIAHSNVGAPLYVDQLFRREDREEAQHASLAKGATLAIGAGDRARPETPDPYRTCFERDRDRILHKSHAFRRLSGKTQVFIFPDDHTRNRLTHALEVAQISVALARALHLNEALAEAIALGHDCGHGPGGHASEDAFAPYLTDGFDHAVWGADVALANLNLCQQTLDGIRNHSWSRPVPATPEGEIVSWADRIAYVCHDFEDAMMSNLVTLNDLPSDVIAEIGVTRGDWIDSFLEGVIEGTLASGYVAMQDGKAQALAAFRQTNYEKIYLRPESRQQGQAVVRVLQALVDFASAHPSECGLRQTPNIPAFTETLSDVAPNEFVEPQSPEALRAAVEWVAGMTDRYACRMAVTHLGWPTDQLPRGLDGRTSF